MQREHLAVLTAVFVALALLAVGATAAFGSAGAEQPAEDAQSDNHAIHVSATGEADAAPDQAIIDVSVNAEGDELDAVRDDISVGAAELTDALDELDVEYETTDYSVDQPRRYHPEERELPEYVGTHAFKITLDDPDRAGTVIDEAVDAGAEIDNVRLTLAEEQRDELRDEAIEAAMDDARHQADTIANASGLEISTVSTVDASQRSFSPVRFDMADEVAEDDAAPPTEIVGGDVSVSYGVDVTYNATSN